MGLWCTEYRPDLQWYTEHGTDWIVLAHLSVSCSRWDIAFEPHGALNFCPLAALMVCGLFFGFIVFLVGYSFEPNDGLASARRPLSWSVVCMFVSCSRRDIALNPEIA